MWWRFIIFCFLVSFILFVVLNYLHDRPVVHFKFFKKGDDSLGNDQIVYERFKDNFLKERLVAFEFDADNGTFVPEDVDIDEIVAMMRSKLNVHNPSTRKIAETFEDFISTTEKDFENHSDFRELDTEFDYDRDINKSELDALKQTDIQPNVGNEDILLTDISYKDRSDNSSRENENMELIKGAKVNDNIGI